MTYFLIFILTAVMCYHQYVVAQHQRTIRELQRQIVNLERVQSFKDYAFDCLKDEYDALRAARASEQ